MLWSDSRNNRLQYSRSLSEQKQSSFYTRLVESFSRQGCCADSRTYFAPSNHQTPLGDLAAPDWRRRSGKNIVYSSELWRVRIRGCIYGPYDSITTVSAVAFACWDRISLDVLGFYSGIKFDLDFFLCHHSYFSYSSIFLRRDIVSL